MTEAIPHILTPGQRPLWHPAAASIWSLDSESLNHRLNLSLLRTLFDQPRWLDAYLLYDEKGSQLFERICQLPEYYLTRTEDSIIAGHAAEVIAAAPVECIVELGAGSAKKTLHLLREQMRQRKAATFVPVDVSLAAMKVSRDLLQHEFPGLSFCGLQARFEDGVRSIRKDLPALFLFLGSTVGNLTRFEFVRFFELLSDAMGPEDYFLLGVDRVKETEILEAAYQDSAGVTAEFILNVFDHINRIAGSNFDRERMRYVSWYNAQWQQVEMYAVSTGPHEIRFPSGPAFSWHQQDSILVEISRKFDPAKLQQQLEFFGFRFIEGFSDAKDWFSLLLFKKNDHLAFQR